MGLENEEVLKRSICMHIQMENQQTILEESYHPIRRKFVRYWGKIILSLIMIVALGFSWLSLLEKDLHLLNVGILLFITIWGLFLVVNIIKDLLYTRKRVKWFTAIGEEEDEL